MQALKHIRTEIFRVTQSEFGQLAGASQAAVSRWESGRLEPTLTHLSCIRNAAKERRLRWNDRWLFEAPPQPSVACAAPAQPGEAA